jgi:hypothetical protein
LAELPELSAPKCNDLPRSFEQHRVLSTSRDLDDIYGADINEMRGKTPHDIATTELSFYSFANCKQGLKNRVKAASTNTTSWQHEPDAEAVTSSKRLRAVNH